MDIKDLEMEMETTKKILNEHEKRLREIENENLNKSEPVHLSYIMKKWNELMDKEHEKDNIGSNMWVYCKTTFENFLKNL